MAVTLYETGRIEFHYGPGNTNLTPTIGISRGYGQNYVLSSFDGSSILTEANSTAFVLEPGIADIGAYEFSGSSLDTTPPVILRTNPSEIDAGGVLPSFDEPLTVTFSEPINVIDAAASSNYELRWAGPDELFESGDDILFDLIPSYAVGSTTVSIDIVGGSLSDGFYRFIIKSNASSGTGIHDLAGILLDGDGDAAEGGDYVRTFSVGLVTTDFDGDGNVDGEDLDIWEGGFGTTDGADLSDGDTDGDADVDGNDFLSWQQNFDGSSIPEPNADFNSDGNIDDDDLSIWEDGFGTTNGADLSGGDADGDRDVDGNDFLSWQQNFSPGPASGAAAGSSDGSEATDAGGGAFFSTTDAAAGASGDAAAVPLGPVLTRGEGNSGQNVPALPEDRHSLSFESVDDASWSLPQPMRKTNGNTSAWLDLPQFQSRGADRPLQRDLAVDTVMSRLDVQNPRVDLNRLHKTATEMAFANVTTEYDNITRPVVHGIAKVGPYDALDENANLETVFEELRNVPWQKSKGFLAF